jgi:hypothetical protein
MDKQILFAGEKIPADLDYAYIIGRDGFYLFKRTLLFEAVVKVDKIPLLDEEKETATLLAPKIPYPLIAEALAFFRAVYEKYRSEAMVFLLFENKAWSIEPGAQEVASASVSYENALHKSGKRPAGTIHSHCNMGASFSGIDDGDDMHSDGVHITIGKISEEFPEIACSLAVNGSRFHIESKDLISDLPAAKLENHPWLDKVRKKDVAADGAWNNWQDPLKEPPKKEEQPKQEDNSDFDKLNFIQKVALYNRIRETLCIEAEMDSTKEAYLMEAMAEKGEDFLWL